MDAGDLLALCAAARDGEEAAGLAQLLAPPTGGSTRLAAAWLPGDTAVALLARRPKGARGQDQDELSVAIAGELAPPGIEVFDPRLSSIYGAGGVPRRFGVELWLGEDEEGEQHPLRVGGEVTGEPTVIDGVTVYRVLTRAASGEGAGIYAMVAG